MGVPKAFRSEEIPQGFKSFTWRKPAGSKNCGDAESIRSEKTGYTVVKIGLSPEEVQRVIEKGEVFLVLCSPHHHPIPPFWAGAFGLDAVTVADRELQ